MDYSDAYPQSVMPAKDPPSEAIPAAVMEELGRLDFYEDYGFPSGASFADRTYAVFEQRRLGNYVWEQSVWEQSGFPRYLFHHDDMSEPSVQFGLFDPDFEERGYGLIVAMAASEIFPSPFLVGRVRCPNLKRSSLRG